MNPSLSNCEPLTRARQLLCAASTTDNSGARAAYVAEARCTLDALENDVREARKHLAAMEGEIARVFAPT